jgi:hypothetical protein
MLTIFNDHILNDHIFNKLTSNKKACPYNYCISYYVKKLNLIFTISKTKKQNT